MRLLLPVFALWLLLSACSGPFVAWRGTSYAIIEPVKCSSPSEGMMCFKVLGLDATAELREVEIDLEDGSSLTCTIAIMSEKNPITGEQWWLWPLGGEDERCDRGVGAESAANDPQNQ